MAVWVVLAGPLTIAGLSDDLNIDATSVLFTSGVAAWMSVVLSLAAADCKGCVATASVSPITSTDFPGTAGTGSLTAQ